MLQATRHRYIVRKKDILSGEPIIEGTRTPVRAIVELWQQGVLPEEIPGQLPHLTLAQVFDALSYYSDHQDEIDEYIERNQIPDEAIEPLTKTEHHQKNHVISEAVNLPFSTVDKRLIRKHMQELFRILSVEGEPIGIEELQKQMREANLNSNELSRGIIEAREE